MICSTKGHPGKKHNKPWVMNIGKVEQEAFAGRSWSPVTFKTIINSSRVIYSIIIIFVRMVLNSFGFIKSQLLLCKIIKYIKVFMYRLLK